MISYWLKLLKDDAMTFNQLGLVPKREGSMSNLWRNTVKLQKVFFTRVSWMTGEG